MASAAEQATAAAVLATGVVSVVYCSARRGARRAAHVAAGGGGVAVWRLTLHDAAWLPVAASAALVLVFLAFKTFDEAFMAACLAGGTACVAFALHPAAAACLRGWRGTGRDDPAPPLLPPRVAGARRLAASAAACVTVAWAWNGHWLLNDAVVCAVAVAVIAVVRLPSVRVAAALAAAVVAFRWFWSTLAAAALGDDLLAAVATHEADSAVADVVRRAAVRLPPGWGPRPTLHLPSLIAVPVWHALERSVYLPNAPTVWVTYNWQDLALSNVVVPGMLVAFARYLDITIGAGVGGGGALADGGGTTAAAAACMSAWRTVRHDATTPSLFRAATAGFAVGVLVVLAAGGSLATSGAGLLVLLPATLGAMALHAARAGDATLHALWAGAPQ